MLPTGGLSSLAAVVPAVALGGVLLGGAVAYNAGAVKVAVEDKRADGDRVRFWIPAVVVPIALKFVPDEKLREAAQEAHPWLPAIEAAAEELAHTPDSTLVEVVSRQEKVRVAKRGRSLVIDVDSPDETVHVSVPVRLVADVARELDAAHLPN